MSYCAQDSFLLKSRRLLITLVTPFPEKYQWENSDHSRERMSICWESKESSLYCHWKTCISERIEANYGQTEKTHTYTQTYNTSVQTLNNALMDQIHLTGVMILSVLYFEILEEDAGLHEDFYLTNKKWTCPKPQKLMTYACYVLCTL